MKKTFFKTGLSQNAEILSESEMKQCIGGGDPADLCYPGETLFYCYTQTIDGDPSEGYVCGESKVNAAVKVLKFYDAGGENPTDIQNVNCF